MFSQAVSLALLLLPLAAQAGPVARGGASTKRILPGPATCAPAPGTLDVFVFAAVQIKEHAELTLGGSLVGRSEPQLLLDSPQSGLNMSDTVHQSKRGFLSDLLKPKPPTTNPPTTSVNTGLKLEVDLDLEVCLCVHANVDLRSIPLGGLEDVAKADVRAYILAKASLGLDVLVNLFVAALDKLGLHIRLTLTPIGGQVCGQCPATKYPTCTGGQCGCANCPEGQIFSETLQRCVMPPSPLARAKRSIPGLWTPQQIKGRQATREDIVKRQTVKSGTRAI